MDFTIKLFFLNFPVVAWRVRTSDGRCTRILTPSSFSTSSAPPNSLNLNVLKSPSQAMTALFLPSSLTHTMPSSFSVMSLFTGLPFQSFPSFRIWSSIGWKRALYLTSLIWSLFFFVAKAYRFKRVKPNNTKRRIYPNILPIDYS